MTTAKRESKGQEHTSPLLAFGKGSGICDESAYFNCRRRLLLSLAS